MVEVILHQVVIVYMLNGVYTKFNIVSATHTHTLKPCRYSTQYLYYSILKDFFTEKHKYSNKYCIVKV